MIRFFIAFLFLLLAPFKASAENVNFCLNQSKTQTAQRHYSIDIDLKQATDRAGWTWTKSEWDGDMWPLDIIKSPDGGSRASFPKLYYKTCSYWQDLWGSCRFASSSFSKSAGVAFITGSQKNIFGFKVPKTYALYGDTKIELPSNFNKSTQYRGDIPALGYAALRGLNEELVLFNGDQSISIEIPEAKSRKDGLPSWGISNDINTNRSFLHTNALKDAPMFLYEIVDGPNVHKIKLDPNMKGWITLLSEPSTNQMFIIDRYGIYAEVGKAFKRIAHLPEASYIYGPANLGYTKDNHIYFAVVDSDKNKMSYILQPKSNTQNCDVALSLNDDIDIKSK